MIEANASRFVTHECAAGLVATTTTAGAPAATATRRGGAAAARAAAATTAASTRVATGVGKGEARLVRRATLTGGHNLNPRPARNIERIPTPGREPLPPK